MTDKVIKAALNRAISLGETGIAVAVYYRGALIIDEVAGVANPTTNEIANPDTLWPVFSVTKGVTALAVHIQAERGFVDYAAPVCKYWPEFGCNGKESITVEDALCHRAGIPQMPEGVTAELMADWDWMVAQVANYTPVFAPGTANAYHVLVWGWLLGEVVRRTDPAKRTFDVFIQEEICKPLSITNFYLGVPDSHMDRVAKLSGGNAFPLKDQHNICPSLVFPGSAVHNQPVIQQAVLPGAGAISTAASIARIFALLAEGGEIDGVRLLSKARVSELAEPRHNARDPDKVLPIPVWFSKYGYWIGGEPNISDPLVGGHRNIIYSPGAGGSLAFADLSDRIAVAICKNNMDSPAILEPERTISPVIRAIREVIAQQDF
ncbi:beta-lactamase [Thozetella sp. PMI_491]|nr:beta-lactamase [Thozetella sp. PMI_491]